MDMHETCLYPPDLNYRLLKRIRFAFRGNDRRIDSGLTNRLGKYPFRIPVMHFGYIGVDLLASLVEHKAL